MPATSAGMTSQMLQRLAQLRSDSPLPAALSRLMLQNDLAIWRLLLMIAFEGYHSFAIPL